MHGSHLKKGNQKLNLDYLILTLDMDVKIGKFIENILFHSAPTPINYVVGNMYGLNAEIK